MTENKHHGFATLPVEGEDYHFKLDLNAFAHLEDWLEQQGVEADVHQFIQQAMAEGTPQSMRRWRMLRAIFAAGFQTYHPGMTELEAGALISKTDQNVAEVTNFLMEALNAATRATGADLPAEAQELMDEAASGNDQIDGAAPGADDEAARPTDAEAASA